MFTTIKDIGSQYVQNFNFLMARLYLYINEIDKVIFYLLEEIKINQIHPTK